jgi:hypothetical protein
VEFVEKCYKFGLKLQQKTKPTWWLFPVMQATEILLHFSPFCRLNKPTEVLRVLLGLLNRKSSGTHLPPNVWCNIGANRLIFARNWFKWGESDHTPREIMANINKYFSYATKLNFQVSNIFMPWVEFPYLRLIPPRCQP